MGLQGDVKPFGKRVTGSWHLLWGFCVCQASLLLHTGKEAHRKPDTGRGAFLRALNIAGTSMHHHPCLPSLTVGKPRRNAVIFAQRRPGTASEEPPSAVRPAGQQQAAPDRSAAGCRIPHLPESASVGCDFSGGRTLFKILRVGHVFVPALSHSPGGRDVLQTAAAQGQEEAEPFAFPPPSAPYPAGGFRSASAGGGGKENHPGHLSAVV